MTQTVTDEWTEILAEDHNDEIYTLENGAAEMWVVREHDPVESERGITILAEETRSIAVPPEDPLWARCKNTGDTSDVRVVGGYRASTDRYGTLDVDVTSRTGRNVGKVRLMDDNEALITDTNQFPVKIIQGSEGAVPTRAEIEEIDTEVTSQGEAGEANALEHDLGGSPGGPKTKVDVCYSSTGAADLEVKISPYGTTYFPFETVSLDSATDGVYQMETTCRYVKAYLTQNFSAVEVVSRGVQ